MTLPYPHGVETGHLNRQNGVRDPLDIPRRVDELVVVAEPFVEVAGSRLRVKEPETASVAAERVRAEMTQRLLERRPNADETTWTRLATNLGAGLADYEQLDDEAIRHMLLLIDGL